MPASSNFVIVRRPCVRSSRPSNGDAFLADPPARPLRLDGANELSSSQVTTSAPEEARRARPDSRSGRRAIRRCYCVLPVTLLTHSHNADFSEQSPYQCLNIQKKPVISKIHGRDLMKKTEKSCYVENYRPIGESFPACRPLRSSWSLPAIRQLEQADYWS